MIELLLELILELFGEALIQIAFQAVADALGQLFGRTRPAGEARSPALAAIGYATLGAACGGLSLLVFPHSAMHGHAARIAALLLAPVATGLAMVLLGRLRARRGRAVTELERFGYGYTFALGMALVRFAWAQ